MAKDKNDRFQLGKESKRSFDTSKKRRTFDITKDKDEVVAAPIPESTTTTAPVAEKQGNKKKWWIWVLLLLVVAGVAACLLSTRDIKEKDDDVVGPTTETDVVEKSESTDVVTPIENNVGENQSTQTDNVPKAQDDVQDALPESQGDAMNEPEQTTESDDVKPVDAGEQNGNTTTSVKMTDEVVRQKAIQVIRGDYGNGEVRKQRLGADYDVIQREVNNLYRDII